MQKRNRNDDNRELDTDTCSGESLPPPVPDPVVSKEKTVSSFFSLVLLLLLTAAVCLGVEGGKPYFPENESGKVKHGTLLDPFNPWWKNQDAAYLAGKDWETFVTDEEWRWYEHPSPSAAGVSLMKRAKLVHKQEQKYYEVGPVAVYGAGNARSKYHVFDTYLLEDESRFENVSYPFVYAEHWTFRRTPPVWHSEQIVGYNTANNSMPDEDDYYFRESISMMEKELERIPLKNGADMSRRVFYDCRIHGYVPEFGGYPNISSQYKESWAPFTLENLNCENSVFDRASFRNVKFKNCNFRGVLFLNCTFDNCTVEGCDFSLCYFPKGAPSGFPSKVIGGCFKNVVLEGVGISKKSDLSASPLTIEQIRQTQTYKNSKIPPQGFRDFAPPLGEMTNIKLPPDMQETIAAEIKEALEKAEEERKATEERKQNNAEAKPK